MPFQVKISSIATKLAVALLCISTFAIAAPPPIISVEGEPMKARNVIKKTALDTAFRADSNAGDPVVSFFAIDPQRIDNAKRANANKIRKATQIGITQTFQDEAFNQDTPSMQWRNVADGRAAQLKIRSPGAVGIRVAIHAINLPAGAEIRFAGSDTPTQVIHRASGLDVYTLIDDAKRYWTPMTDGDTQTLEVFIPANINTNGIEIKVDAVSHIFASAKDGFKSALQFKGASLCSIDAVCATPTSALLEARRAVAHMQFQAGCGENGALGTCICTGTLLNDTDTTTQIPYFFGANHCIGTQTEANTLTTYWNYDNPTCTSGNGPDLPRSQSNIVFGGAQLLYAEFNTDVLLLRLNNSPPVTAFFSGWTNAAMTAQTPITVIHHPQGDAKKITIGQTLADPFIILTSLANTSYIFPAYSQGITEGGSSGSGLLTQNASGRYLLRGGLLGGPSTCATANNINNPDNRDWYSRFDLAFPNISRFLAATPTTGPLNYSDMWWAGQAENGWGMSIQQHSPSNVQFNALYIYDDNGRPLWVVMPGGTWTNNFTTFSGPVFIPTGTPFSSYNAAAFVPNVSVGTVTLNFSGINAATMSYTINGRSGTKAITRQVFGSGAAPFNVNDLWWGGTSQNGWGINLAQQQGQIFGVWYTYGADNRATWYVMPGGAWLGTTFSGGLFRTIAPAWLGTSFNGALTQGISVGSMTFNFSNANNATMTYNVDGVIQTKTITRQEF